VFLSLIVTAARITTITTTTTRVERCG